MALELTAFSLSATRQRAGWTQQELANRAGTHRNAVRYWEGRQGFIGGRAVSRFAEAFHTAGVRLLVPEKTIIRDYRTGSPIHIFSAVGIAQSQVPVDRVCGATNRQGKPCGNIPFANDWPVQVSRRAVDGAENPSWS